jgi:hypothetical protein
VLSWYHKGKRQKNDAISAKKIPRQSSEIIPKAKDPEMIEMEECRTLHAGSNTI